MVEQALSPADYAMAVVKGDDKVEKFVPLIPLAFGAYGAYRGAGGRFIDDEGKFRPGFYGNARLQDPVTGGLLMDEEIGDSGFARVGGAALGATQALNPLTWAGKGLGAAGRALGASRAARASRLSDEAVAAGNLAYRNTPALGYQTHGVARNAPRRQAFYDAHGAVLGDARGVGRPIANLRHRAGQGVANRTQAGLAGAERMAHTRTAGALGRGMQLSGPVGPALAAGVAALGQDQLQGDPVNIPQVGTSGSALGQGGMGNMAGARHGVNPERQIWSGALEQNRIAAGENMTIGEQLLKEAKEDMDKDKSPKGKGKGMILIIGHGGKKSGKDDEKDSPC
jgi:hypothetical protein